MKIYFEDGYLINSKRLPIKPDFIIDATIGVSECINTFDNIYFNKKNSTIYTNSIMAFSNKYAWNSKLKRPEIYIRDNLNGIFTNICELTNKKLLQVNNLAKMYIDGEFC